MNGGPPSGRCGTGSRGSPTTWYSSRPAGRSHSTSGSGESWRWRPGGYLAAPREQAAPPPAAVQGEPERVQGTAHPFGLLVLSPWVVEAGHAVGVDDRHGGVDVAVALVVGRGPGPHDAQRVDVQVLELLHDRGLVQVARLLDRPVDLEPGVPAFLAVLDRVIVAEARGLHAGDVLGQAGRGRLVLRGAARLGVGQPVLHRPEHVDVLHRRRAAGRRD